MNVVINTKKYIKFLFSIILIFLFYHLMMWTFFTSQIFSPKDGTSVGDLGRMSYQINLLDNRKLDFTLPKSFIHADNYNNQKIDIITIGDSFSQGGGAGTNPYYQDFIATKYNKNILNIKPSAEYNSIEIVIGLYNSGYLQKVKPEAIIIESVERLIAQRFATTINQNINIAEPNISEKILHLVNQDVSIISTANYKIPYYFIAYKFKENAQKNVFKLKLNNHLFSGPNGDNLLIIKQDIASMNLFTKENISIINKNFNNLANKLSTLDIKLYMMPCVDKYDLYYDYIKNHKHPENLFFNLIRPLKKEYYFVDTKKILLPLLQNGVKDVYWIDDTHWSSKASEAITNDKIFHDNMIKVTK